MTICGDMLLWSSKAHGLTCQLLQWSYTAPVLCVFVCVCFMCVFCEWCVCCVCVCVLTM